MPSGCLSHLTKEQPAHLDALRARLVEAAAAAATTKGRDAVLPERDASKKRQRLHALGKVSSSPAMEQAIVAMAGVRTNLAPITPAAAATEVWRALQEAGVCTQGCRVFCKGFVGSSNDFAYNQPRRSGEPSRAAGIDFKRRGGELMAPEKVVHSRCCAADCTPSLSVEGVQAIRDKWFGLVLYSCSPSAFTTSSSSFGTTCSASQDRHATPGCTRFSAWASSPRGGCSLRRVRKLRRIAQRSRCRASTA